MMFVKPRAETSPAAKRLAKALRAGLELRWSIALPSPDGRPNPFPSQGNVRPFLEPYADSLNFPLSGQGNLLRRFLGTLRRLVRKMIAPWLQVQTDFNYSALSVLERIEQRVQSLEESALTSRQHLETLEKSLPTRIRSASGRPILSLDEGFRRRINEELDGQGQLAKAGLWFNPPVLVQLDRQGPRVVEVSERILEHIYVHTHLPRPPARLLDLGCGASTNAIEMASLGFEVVGVDERDLPLSHPNFTMIQANPAALPFEDESFDGAVATLGQERGFSAEQIVAEVRRLLKPGGRFILTAPFGQSTGTPARPLYNRAQLDCLLRGFRAVDRSYGVREGDAWFCTVEEQRAEQADGTERVGAVCLLVLEKP